MAEILDEFKRHILPLGPVRVGAKNSKRERWEKQQLYANKGLKNKVIWKLKGSIWNQKNNERVNIAAIENYRI